MPELPEVETVKRGIEILNNLQIKSVFRSDKKLRINSQESLYLLKQQKINKIKRRARYLICEISNNKSLIIHLGMSGKLTVGKFSHKKHDHFACEFEDKTWLVFNDARRFGFIDLVDNSNIDNHQFLKKLGPEPLLDDFNLKYFANKLKNKSMNIKTALMDNSLVVGVGNIYANESLFDSNISPLCPSNKISEKQALKLINSIKKTLQKAIDLGGSSISDYVNATGEFGGYQSNFRVYGRENEKCFNCNDSIKRIVQNGRSTFFCPKCQT